jgi:ATP-dependent helicase/nuclease subunit A
MTLADQNARDLIRHDLERTLVVEAAAGTGKTTELVRRIISILAEGRTTIEKIIAVTFTDKAAGELKLRLRTGLEKARTEAGSNQSRRTNLEEALAHLEEARAGTIHSFCGDLLRERPMEAGIDPQFEQLDDTAAEQLYGSAFRTWIEGVLENPPEGVRRSLRRYSREDQAMARLERAGWILSVWRDFEAEWARPAFDRIAEIDRLVKQLQDFAALTKQATSTGHIVYQQTRRARDLSDFISTVEKSRARDYDGLEARLIELSKAWDFKINTKGPTGYGQGLSRNDVISAHEVIVAPLLQFGRSADADLAALLATELRQSIVAYENLKERGGKLDFFDLLLKARNLLRDDATVRRDMQGRYTHLFVDEFQDTEPLQAEVLMLLASADPDINDWRSVSVVPGKLFIVGDPKQAIYRFRRADVGLYYDIKDMLVSGGAVSVHLTTSFRSVPFIQNFVNAAFASKMNGDREALRADYVALSPNREQPLDQPSVVALSVPEPYGKRDLAGYAVEKSTPDAVGAFVDWLLNKSNWTVTERSGGGERVPVKARHICLMFRRFDSMFGGDMTRAYAEALQARGIAHVLVGGKSFHDREEVGTMRAALAAIEWPDDTLSVYATLRGSLFAISDADLLAFRSEHGQWHPFHIPEAVSDALQPVKRALEIIRELSKGRNFRPIAETVHQLLSATRAHAGFVMRPGGEQALANVLHVAELARQYEARGALSFRGFVEELIDAAERGKQPEAAIYEEGSEGVRMMSVHRSKGLEFPIVILVDITCKIAHEEPDRFLDAEHGLCAVKLAGWTPQEVIDHKTEEHRRDIAEGVRVAYVAATRARDLLVIPAIGEDKTGGGPRLADHWWVAPLHSALYPAEERRLRPTRASMCPEFGIDTVLRRPNNDLPGEHTIRPGSHGFGSAPSAYSVVWWDPKTLELGKTASFSIRQQELLEKGDDKVKQRRLNEYQAWRDARQKTIEQGSAPTVRFQTATERAKTELPISEVVVGVVEIARAARPYGPRFGSLVHATLASVSLTGDNAEISAVAELQGRILGATDTEVSAAIDAVSTALRHPLMRRAQAAALQGKCYRELPLTLRLVDRMVVEGIADLVFCEDDRWMVVDFKTDQELATGLENYRRQLAIYATAVGEANAAQSEAFLLRV